MEIGFTSVGTILEAAMPVFEQARRASGEEILTHLQERNRDLVTVGAADTLQALFDRRVMTLVVQERAELSGRRCPSCGWLTIGAEGTCPSEGTQTQARDDIVDDAIDLALQQDARVVQIPQDAERQPDAELAALLRF